MPQPDHKFMDRLVKLLGMLGSAHAGERAVAAAKANELIRSAGFTWSDVFARINEKTASAADWRSMRDVCLRHEARLNTREREFVAGLMYWRGSLTEKQHAWLAAIHARLQHQAAQKGETK